MREKIKLDGNYFENIFKDTGYALSSPSRWEKSDWVTASVVAGFTGLFFALDDEIKEEVHGSRNAVTDNFSEIFERFGNDFDPQNEIQFGQKIFKIHKKK